MDNKLEVKSQEAYSQIRNTLITAQVKVTAAVNSAMVQAYWEIGEQIYLALVITNATLISREIAKKFSECNIGIQVSLNGSCAEIHDKLCGAGNFNKTMQGF
ncbi:MAG: hypothetical protein WCD89_12310, partial [Anaerocolumna sp.]